MLLILCGKSSSGKDSVANELTKQDGAKRLVSLTSRPARNGETNGLEYLFVSKDEFLSRIESGNLVEFRSYSTMVGGIADTWYYGTEKFEKAKEDEIAVAIKDLEGAKLLKDYCETIGEPCIAVLMEASDKKRETWAKKRGSFDQVEWNRRLEADREDFSDESIAEVADYFVDNDGEDSVSQIAERIKMWCRDAIREEADRNFPFGDSRQPIDRMPKNTDVEFDL